MKVVVILFQKQYTFMFYWNRIKHKKVKKKPKTKVLTFGKRTLPKRKKEKKPNENETKG